MALVIDNEPLSETANSYVSLAEMLTYLQERVANDAYRVAWVALSDGQKGSFLANSTRFLDSAVDWIGDRYYGDQKLDWPRMNAYFDGHLLDVPDFPQQVKDATCEMAMWQMENQGVVSVGKNAQFDRIKVGVIEIDFNEAVGGSSQQYFPDTIAYLLAGLGVVNNPLLPSSNQLKQVKLQRA